jgi:hypothetical protein
MVFLPYDGTDCHVVSFNEAEDMRGMYYEVGESFEQCPISDPILLGEVTKRQFHRSTLKELPRSEEKEPKHRLIASKMKSERQFENAYASYQVRGANSANIIMVFESPKILLKPIYVGASCNALDEVAIGNTLIELHNFYSRAVHRSTAATA